MKYILLNDFKFHHSGVWFRAHVRFVSHDIFQFFEERYFEFWGERNVRQSSDWIVDMRYVIMWMESFHPSGIILILIWLSVPFIGMSKKESRLILLVFSVSQSTDTLFFLLLNSNNALPILFSLPRHGQWILCPDFLLNPLRFPFSWIPTLTVEQKITYREEEHFGIQWKKKIHGQWHITIRIKR